MAGAKRGRAYKIILAIISLLIGLVIFLFATSHSPNRNLIEKMADRLTLTEQSYTVLLGIAAIFGLLGVAEFVIGVKTYTDASSSGNSDQNIEMEFWQSIKNSSNPEDYRAYLNKYPAGYFADIARNRLQGC